MKNTFPLRNLSYTSNACKEFTPQELLDLLRLARDANARHGITGMLLYREGTFIQTLEGPHDEIGQLFENICNDPSHHRITKLTDEPIAARSYPDWSMGFKNMTPKHAAEPGYNEYISADETLLEAMAHLSQPGMIFEALRLIRH